MPNTTDRALIAGIANCDAQALRELYNRHSSRVYNTALTYLQNETDAEEVSQDVFTKVWRSAAGFKAESQVTTWLYRIAVNTSLTALKKKQRRGIFGMINPGQDPPDFHHPEAKLEEREENKAIFSAIYRLPDRQKTAFVLSYVEELPRQQVADIMGLSLKAVEGLLMRAKKSLRNTIER
ncbi:RNA polymerase sigma factor [Neolewinella aurantiaca]|uniref:RNA polymerase sigma factor n=1 Tax=Neolewinella aurantiaca TaxID=2602767 RepID=A0A5C7FG75_9BACT|nr:RNA polymerase sigma factor [Neolewinella aurantiaca]TXF86297.1 RNA polymerase sigma factor [Neolewinella aurantiaca]